MYQCSRSTGKLPASEFPYESLCPSISDKRQAYLSDHSSAEPMHWGKVIGMLDRTARSTLSATAHYNEAAPFRALKAYLAAWSKLLSLRNNALMIINVVLPAVLCLVLVGESGIVACAG